MFTVGELVDSGGNDVNIEVNFIPNQAELLARYFTPSVSIPPEVTVPFHSQITKRIAMLPTAGGDEVTVESGNLS